MAIYSNAYLIFTAAAAAVYYLTPGRWQWVSLLVFSILSYLSVGTQFFGYMLFSIVLTWAGALAVESLEAKGREKAAGYVLIAALVLNFGMLGRIKYAAFAAENLNALLGTHFGAAQLLFPIGISFYTFQSSGYLLDVYWKRIAAEKNPLRHALFVSFYPQILQGPISRYTDLAPQLFAPHRPGLETIRRGLWRMLIGLFKKLVLADWAAIFVDTVWRSESTYGGCMIPGLLLFYVEIYMDFSGAMDIVIGTGELFGITMPENFRRPYLAASVSEYWRRWHITLGAWMMNYVFFPLSLAKWTRKLGNAAKKRFGRPIGRAVPAAVSQMIVFLLVGVWHGANWKYIIFGLCSGVAVAAEEFYAVWKKARAQKAAASGTAAAKRAAASGAAAEHRNTAAVTAAAGTASAGRTTASGAAAAKRGASSGAESAPGLIRRLPKILLTQAFVLLTFSFYASDDLPQSLRVLRLVFTRFSPAALLSVPAGRSGAAGAPGALLLIVAGTAAVVAVGCLKETGRVPEHPEEALPEPVRFAAFVLLLVGIGILGCTAAPKGFIYAQF